MFIEASPDLSSVHLKPEFIREARHTPVSFDSLAIDESTSILYCVSTDILFGEGDLTSVSNSATQVELAYSIRAASEDSTSNVDLEVAEVHVLLLTILEVVSFPSNNLVWYVGP